MKTELIHGVNNLTTSMETELIPRTAQLSPWQ